MQKISRQQQRENCKKWGRALRSGNYKPSAGFYRCNDTYSPAGVGLDVSSVSEWRLVVEDDSRKIYSYVLLSDEDGTNVSYTSSDILHAHYGMSYEKIDYIATMFDKCKSFLDIAVLVDWELNLREEEK